MQMFPDLYKNAFKCGIQTFKKDGIYRGLYAGIFAFNYFILYFKLKDIDFI
jgi:hypothetical protein